MCLILFAYQTESNYPFIVAANRDEYYLRPTAPASFWKDNPDILAGRDLKKMGTWMGVNRKGSFAAVTNYRDISNLKQDAQSRGELVSNFLANSSEPEQYLKKIKRIKDKYNGFNLLTGNLEKLFYYSNIEDKIIRLDPGIYGLSNAFLNTPWPKVLKGKQMLKEVLNSASVDVLVEKLFLILADAEPFADELLPDTGVGMEMERTLSPLFISSANYGTRSSTVIIIDHEGTVTFKERTFHKRSTSQWQEVAYKFQI